MSWENMLSGFLAFIALVAVLGDTRHKYRRGLRQITWVGWLTVAAAIVVLGIQIKINTANAEQNAARDNMLARIAASLGNPNVVQMPVELKEAERALLDSIVVQQDVGTPVGRQATVRLSVAVKDQSKRNELLARIERVVYQLDPQSYKNSTIEVTNPIGGFRYTFGALGSTAVSALIYLKDPDAKVVRQGWIRTDKYQEFGAAAAVATP